VPHALRVEKIYQHYLDEGHLELQFLRPRESLTNPFRTLSLCFGVIGKTPGLISRNNFVKKFVVCIDHRDNVLVRCNMIFPLLRCQGVWNNTCTQSHLSKSSFRIRITTDMGMFKHSAIILDAIRRSFLTKSGTATMFTPVRVDFGRSLLSSFSTSSLPSRNRELLLLIYLCSRFGRLHVKVKSFYTFLCSVLQLSNYFHNSLQEIHKLYSVILQPADRLSHLYIVGIILFKKTLSFPQFSLNQAYFFPLYLKTTPFDKLKMKSMKSLHVCTVHQQYQSTFYFSTIIHTIIKSQEY
jgi:hypothetical protein